MTVFVIQCRPNIPTISSELASIMRIVRIPARVPYKKYLRFPTSFFPDRSYAVDTRNRAKCPRWVALAPPESVAIIILHDENAPPKLLSPRSTYLVLVHLDIETSLPRVAVAVAGGVRFLGFVCPKTAGWAAYLLTAK